VLQDAAGRQFPRTTPEETMTDETRIPSFETELWQDPPVLVLKFFRGDEEHRFEFPIHRYQVVRRGYTHDDSEVIVENGKVV
jgi:hypothetical protein